MRQSPSLSPEQVEQLYQELHKLKGQNDFLAQNVAGLHNQIHQMTNIHVILAAELFKKMGYIQENVIITSSFLKDERPMYRVGQPLIHSVSQTAIDGLEHLFAEGLPTIGFTQEIVNGFPHLIIKLVSVPQAEAEEGVSPTIN
jgi:hypothetical protein